MCQHVTGIGPDALISATSDTVTHAFGKAMTDCTANTLPIDTASTFYDAPVRSPRLAGWIHVTLAVVAVAVLLSILPGRSSIPPLVESDYCYLFIAADRLFEGLGPTAPQPVAPLQPWNYESDWTFLTRWPIGFPALVCAVRYLTNCSTIEACRFISVLACAAALVGWFIWVRKTMPNGVTGLLLGMVAAGCAVSFSLLINPSTDLLVVALLPYIFMACLRAMGGAHHAEPPTPTSSVFKKFYPSRAREEAVLSDDQKTAPSRSRLSKKTASPIGSKPSVVWSVVAGLPAGGLFWIRYASLFVPAAVGLFLLIAWWRRLIRLKHVATFAVSAAVPIVALLTVNRIYGASGSIQSQLNLGQTVALSLTPDLVGRAWWNFTDFSFYAHHGLVHWVYALWPAGLAMVALTVRPIRRRLQEWLATPAVALSAATVVVLLAMLIAVTAVFGNKYDFVSLARYYTPVKPLYFVLFVGPLLLVRWRAMRIGAGVALIVACTWLVRQDWGRAYDRQIVATTSATPYGQRAVCFGAGASDLYSWLNKQKAADLILVSNFHEYVTLETGIPALPIPRTPETLEEWVERVRASRGIDQARVLFVLDPDNRWRNYWIKPPAEIITDFHLQHQLDIPIGQDALVFEYHPS
jgi:hypothetical protein